MLRIVPPKEDKIVRNDLLRSKWISEITFNTVTIQWGNSIYGARQAISYKWPKARYAGIMALI